MSYRKPEIIQNQSGLIVPQAIAKAAENISQAWSKQLSDQRKLNLARREEDRKNDLGVEQATANAMAALKKGAGGETLVNTARESQVEIINDLDEILKELNNRNLDPSRKKILRAAELELRNGLTDMNATFGKISTTMTAAQDFNINKAGNLGKKTATTEENLTFGLGLDKGEATYNYTGYKRDKDGALILDGTSKVGLSITSGGVTVQANQFTSDGWTAITDVTQIQPDIDAATSSKLTGKGGKLLQTALETATYEMKVPVYNAAGKKVSTKTVMNQAATEGTNQFLNEQTQLAFAAIQAGQNPVETRNILKNQYNMSEADIDTFLNVKDAGMAAMANTTLNQEAVESVLSNLDDVNSKLQFSIAQTIANPLDLKITNPDDATGAYTFGKETQGGPAAQSSGSNPSELQTRISYSKGRFKETNTLDPNMSAANLFETAGNFAVGKTLKIGNTWQDVRGFSKNGNTVNIAYGTGPDFVSYTGNDQAFLKKFETARNNPAAAVPGMSVIDPNTNLEVDVTFATELKRRGIIDRKTLEIDLSDKIKSLPGLRKAFNITEKAAGELWDSYFKPKFTTTTQ